MFVDEGTETGRGGSNDFLCVEVGDTFSTDAASEDILVGVN